MKTKVLLIEDDKRDAGLFEIVLKNEGFRVETASTAEEGFRRASSGEFDVILTDLNLSPAAHREGRELVVRLRAINPHLPVILMTGGHSAEIAIDAIQQGAFDYFSKPSSFADETFRTNLADMIELAAASKRLMTRVKLPDESATETLPASDRIIGRSRVMQKIYQDIGRLAVKPVTVLIRGETGTGKELVARALYTHSDRAKQPFVVVNCTAIPEHLLESELFGHEPGSFTGAKGRRIGRFEKAHGGTLFLDEIGDMSWNLQQRLLRVLQEQSVERVGGRIQIPVNIRILAATHRDLEAAVQDNEFRQDLYFRLNVAVISLPPLRERREDIPDLVNYFVSRYGAELGSATSTIEPEAVACLQRQSWPGNVRELRNVIRKALLIAHGYAITKRIVHEALDRTKPPSPKLHQPFAAHVARMLDGARIGEYEQVMSDLTEMVERELYAQAIRRANGDQTKAARWLGVSRPTMRDKLRRYGLHFSRDQADN